MPWVSGRHARLFALKTRPELNGVEVILLDFNVSTERWGVQVIVSTELLSVKASNLESSASLLELLGADEINCILMHVPLRGITVIMQTCRQLSDRAASIAKSAGWQLEHATLMELVHGGADASVIREKHHRLVNNTLSRHPALPRQASDIQQLIDGGLFCDDGFLHDELLGAARFVVRSGGTLNCLHALWDLSEVAECAEWASELRIDLVRTVQDSVCALLRCSRDNLGQAVWENFDECGFTLLHHAALCGASLSMVELLVGTSPETTTAPDDDDLLPMHHAAICGSSPQVVRLLIQHTLRSLPHLVEEVYGPESGCTLLHLALQGGKGAWDLPRRSDPPLSSSQNAVAMMLLCELQTLAPPPVDWDDFVPPAQQPIMVPAWAPSRRYPLHLAAVAAAAQPLIAALLEAYPPAARLRDARPNHSDLAQPYGYLPAHYALGAARGDCYSSCRPCSAQVQAILLAAYPFEEWPLIDLIRAGPTALAEPAVEALVLSRIANLSEEEECTAWYEPQGGKVESDLFLHVAVAHAATPPILSALISRRPEHARVFTIGSGQRVLPLHLARTAGATTLLLSAHPEGAKHRSKGREPFCEPLAYALRNGAPDDVVRVLTAHHREFELDAFANEIRTLGRTWSLMRKSSRVDMHRMWKGCNAREAGLRRLIRTDLAAAEDASPLLAAIIEERDVEVVRALLAEVGGREGVSRGARPWGCDCPNAGGCPRCVGRRLPGGWTPLHEAACQGRPDLVELLLVAGADATCVTAVHREGGGNTPLAVAIDQQHQSCVELLQAHLAREIEVHDASRQGDQADLAREIEVVAFSGQGIPSGQLAELRRVSKLEPVHAFLSMLSQCFAKELEAMPAAATAHFADGLDVAKWATSSPADSPSIAYLNSTSVTLVLTFAIQLACFRYAWVRSGCTYPRMAGTIGHSQGVAAALVVALASCEHSFTEHACVFGRVLLRLGLTISQRVPPADSYALAVLKATTDEVALRVRAHSGVYLVVCNGARACTVAGGQKALEAFHKAAVADRVTCKRLPVRAPYHCAELLSEACAATLQQLADEPPIRASQLKLPCWSCVDGSDISVSGLSTLQGYLVDALCRLPVDWPRAVNAAVKGARGNALNSCTDEGPRGDASSSAERHIPLVFVDFGPGGGSGVARMTNVICKEDLNERDDMPSCRAEYFTQRHCVPGQLPQSWLQWIRSSEESPDDADSELQLAALVL